MAKADSSKKAPPKDGEPGKRGRPKITLTPEQLEKLTFLAKLHCSKTEIAAELGIHVDTLRDNFSTEIEKGRELGKSHLRSKMWQAALSGNVALQIWLSKQHLGMSEKVESKNETTSKGPIVYVAEWGGKGEPAQPGSAEDSGE